MIINFNFQFYCIFLLIKRWIQSTRTFTIVCPSFLVSILLLSYLISAIWNFPIVNLPTLPSIFIVLFNRSNLYYSLCNPHKYSSSHPFTNQNPNNIMFITTQTLSLSNIMYKDEKFLLIDSNERPLLWA